MYIKLWISRIYVHFKLSSCCVTNVYLKIYMRKMQAKSCKIVNFYFYLHSNS